MFSGFCPTSALWHPALCQEADLYGFPQWALLAFWLWVGFGQWQVLAGEAGVGRKQGQVYSLLPALQDHGCLGAVGVSEAWV